MLKLYDFKSDVSGKTDEKHDCIRMTHLTQSKKQVKIQEKKGTSLLQEKFRCLYCNQT